MCVYIYIYIHTHVRFTKTSALIRGVRAIFYAPRKATTRASVKGTTFTFTIAIAISITTYYYDYDYCRY